MNEQYIYSIVYLILGILIGGFFPNWFTKAKNYAKGIEIYTHSLTFRRDINHHIKAFDDGYIKKDNLRDRIYASLLIALKKGW